MVLFLVVLFLTKEFSSEMTKNLLENKMSHFQQRQEAEQNIINTFQSQIQILSTAETKQEASQVKVSALI